MKGLTSELEFNVAEIELVYRHIADYKNIPVTKSSQQNYELLLSVWDKDKIDLVEQFKILLLNRAFKVLALYTVSTGGVSGTVADPRLIFTAALKINASAIVLAHNHPSGNLNPSRADEELTRKIKNAGLFLDIMVLDHLIITSTGYYSFSDEGLI